MSSRAENLPGEKEPREQVRLTEDILYLVNKKLAKEDRERRNRVIESAQMYRTEHRCFTDVKYRKANAQLSETGQGVTKSVIKS